MAKAALRGLALVNHLPSVEPLGQPSQLRGASDGGYFVPKLSKTLQAGTCPRLFGHVASSCFLPLDSLGVIALDS